MDWEWCGERHEGDGGGMKWVCENCTRRIADKVCEIPIANETIDDMLVLHFP